MDDNSALFDHLFEVSWEVCNKIGGIYTVLSTKAKTLQSLYKDKAIFVGPDVWTDETPSPTFVEDPRCLRRWQAQAQLPYGIKVRVGRWAIPGKPIAVLVKFDSMYAHKDEFYARFWEMYGVDSLHGYGDYDEACAFALSAAVVIESISEYMRSAAASRLNIIAHFDEWTTGMGLLYTAWRQPSIATIFTTHATSIGRSICGNNKPLYDYMKGYNGDQMAGELNMQSKHSLEKAAAQTADCFTTVSDVTAIECEQLLERRPDVVTPNGFEKSFVPAKSRFAAARRRARAKLLQVASALTGEQLPDDAFIVATSGRCEYRNKGIDCYIDAMSRLAQNAGHRKVVSFVMVPAWSRSPRADLVEALAAPAKKAKAGLADPVITHTLNNPDSDPIIGHIHRAGLDHVDNPRVIYVPCYLNGDDGIFDAPYYDLLIGMDATVFPSYYEPWGYTPLESVAFGTPTITTSLSGFGQWIANCFGPDARMADCGVKVVKRTDGNYHEVVDQIAAALTDIIAASPAECADISAAARETASMAAWSYFIDYYVLAYTMAIDAARERQ